MFINNLFKSNYVHFLGICDSFVNKIADTIIQTYWREFLLLFICIKFYVTEFVILKIRMF